MEYSTQDRQGERDPSVPLGPAVSPRRPAGSARAAESPEPLPPFVRPRRGTAGAPWEAAAAPGEQTDAGAGALEAEPVTVPEWTAEPLPAEAPPAQAEEVSLPDDLPWLSDAAPAAALEAEDPGQVPGAEWGPAGDGAEAEVDITDLLWEGPEQAGWAPEISSPPSEPSEPVAPEQSPAEEPPAPPMESEGPEALEEWTLVAGAGETPAAAPVQRVESAIVDALRSEEGVVLEEVAGRLERIALALREGRPVELFASGAADPLEVLIAGYALGYSEAFRRVSEERRGGR